MISKLLSVWKTCWYKFRYGNEIRFGSIATFEGTSRINLKDGIANIGAGLRMKTNAYLAIVNGGVLTLGERVSINRNSIVVCHDKITIGDGCTIAPNVAIYDHDHRFGIDGVQKGYKTSAVVIEDNCWIGAGVIILRGTHIGEGSVIGAGCVVKGRIPAHSLVRADRTLDVMQIR